MHGDARIEGYNYCMPLGTALETLLAMSYNSFILTVGIIGAGIYCIGGGGYKVFDSHARDMYGNSHSEGTCVLLEIPSMHKLVRYFQSLYRSEDIFGLKGVHIANFEGDVCLNSVGKILHNSQNLRTYYMLNHRIRCIYSRAAGARKNTSNEQNVRSYYMLNHRIRGLLFHYKKNYYLAIGFYFLVREFRNILIPSGRMKLTMSKMFARIMPNH